MTTSNAAGKSGGSLGRIWRSAVTPPALVPMPMTSRRAELLIGHADGDVGGDEPPHFFGMLFREHSTPGARVGQRSLPGLSRAPRHRLVQHADLLELLDG